MSEVVIAEELIYQATPLALQAAPVDELKNGATVFYVKPAWHDVGRF